jgi:hypothetical protein
VLLGLSAGRPIRAMIEKMRQLCRRSKHAERSIHRFPQTLAIGLPTGQRLLPIMVILGSKFCLRRLAANHNSLAPNGKIGAAACPKSDGPDSSEAVIGGEWVEFMSAAELFKCPNCGSQLRRAAERPGRAVYFEILSNRSAAAHKTRESKPA